LDLSEGVKSDPRPNFTVTSGGSSSHPRQIEHCCRSCLVPSEKKRNSNEAF